MFLFIHLKKPVPQSTWHPVCWTFSSLTAAAVPHPSNVMAIHSTTSIGENGKDILRRGGIIKAFVLAEMAEFLLNYDNTNLDTLPVDFFMSNLTGSNSSCMNWGRQLNNLSQTKKMCCDKITFLTVKKKITKLVHYLLPTIKLMYFFQ